MKLGMQVGRPRPWPHCVRWGPIPLPKGAQPPIFGPYLLRPNGCMDQDFTWYGARTQPRRLCVRWRPSPPPQKGAEPPPQFAARVYCGQTAGWIKMPLGTKVGISPGDSVLDGHPVHLPTKGVEPPPQFSGYFYCGQTAGCIKMPLGTEVGLSPGEPLPQFWAHVYCGTTWYGGRPPLTRDCVRCGPSYSQKKRPHPPPPNFWTMSIVAKWLDE